MSGPALSYQDSDLAPGIKSSRNYVGVQRQDQDKLLSLHLQVYSAILRYEWLTLFEAIQNDPLVLRSGGQSGALVIVDPRL